MTDYRQEFEAKEVSSYKIYDLFLFLTESREMMVCKKGKELFINFQADILFVLNMERTILKLK